MSHKARAAFSASGQSTEMPRIPIITATGGAVVANASRVYGVDAAGTLIAQHGLNTLSSSLNDIASRMKRQEEDIEFSATRGSYDPDLQRLRKNVLVDPTLDNPFMAFNEQAQELQKTYLDRIKSPNVRTAFEKYISATFPQVQSDALDDSLKLQNQKNIAGLHSLADTLSAEAATGTPEVRDRAIAEFNDHMDRAAKYGTVNPIDAVDAKKKFRVDVMTKNMDAMARTDPYKLFELHSQGVYKDVDENIRLRTLEFARKDIEHADAERTRLYKQAQLENYKYYGTLANQGAIPEAELESMIKGEHPYVTDPAEVHALAVRNANPIIGPSTAVEAILLNFHAMSMSSPEKVLQAAQTAREQLDYYRKTATKRDPALDKAYHSLQQVELTIAAAERATQGAARSDRREERDIQRLNMSTENFNEAQIQRNIKKGVELYKAGIVAKIAPSMISKFDKIKETVDMNELAQLIRGGIDPKEAVDIIRGKRKEQQKASPPSKVQELVPR